MPNVKVQKLNPITNKWEKTIVVALDQPLTYTDSKGKIHHNKPASLQLNKILEQRKYIWDNEKKEKKDKRFKRT